MAELENKAVSETAESKQDKLLGEITSLRASIANDTRAIWIVGVLIIAACLANLALIFSTNLTSPFMAPALYVSSMGNYLYVTRLHRKKAKLTELNDSYKSEFGALSA